MNNFRHLRRISQAKWIVVRELILLWTLNPLAEATATKSCRCCLCKRISTCPIITLHFDRQIGRKLIAKVIVISGQVLGWDEKWGLDKAEKKGYN
jgi:hypothetical protein